MKKIILFLMLCSSLLLSQEIHKTLENFRGGIKIEMGSVYMYNSYGDKNFWDGGWGISLPLRYTINTQWATEINPGLTFTAVVSGVTMGMRCYYFPFRNEYDKRNFLVFLGLDNDFVNEGLNGGYTKYNSTTPIVSLLFGTGIQIRESSAFDLSVSIPFNHYTYSEKMYALKMYAFVRLGITWFF